jgi:hypothetical protein
MIEEGIFVCGAARLILWRWIRKERTVLHQKPADTIQRVVSSREKFVGRNVGRLSVV